MTQKNQPPTLADWLNLRRKPDFTKARPLGTFFGICLLLIVGFLIAMLAATMWDFLRAAFRSGPYADDTTGEAIRNIGLVLAAFFGAPFLVWRTWVAARQTNLQDEALFNDKINAAATDLAARRQVTRVVEQDQKEVVLTEWEDDLVTRAAAIDRLEGLALEAMERQDYAPAQRIARMLSIYVQELSRAYPPLDPDDDAHLAGYEVWEEPVIPARPDMESAAQSLGRINPPDETNRAAFGRGNIDLRRCNLQGFDLRGLNLQGANLEMAQLQGANLGRAQLQGADLGWAQLQGASLGGAQLQGANLSFANLQSTDLMLTDLRGAFLFSARLQGANVNATQMSGNTNLGMADLRGAAVWVVDATTLEQLMPHWETIIYFGVTLPNDAPAHWVQTDGAIGSSNYYRAWRDWVAKAHPDVIIAPDWQH